MTRNTQSKPSSTSPRRALQDHRMAHMHGQPVEMWTGCHNRLRRYAPFKKTLPYIYEVCSVADRTHILRL
jgi:hypothetical protein